MSDMEDDVLWTELQVWIGIPFYEKTAMGHYSCAPAMIYYDHPSTGEPVPDRRCSRLIRRSPFVQGYTGEVPGSRAVTRDDDNVIVE